MSKFKVGDELGLFKAAKVGYKVVEVFSNGLYRVICLTDNSSFTSGMEGYELMQNSSETHLYKMGDIIQWHNYSTQYEVVHIYNKKSHYYDFKSTKENVLYEHMRAEAKETYLVSSGKSPSPQIAEKCRWATPQPLDVEPMYYRVYGVGRPTYHPSTASQHEAIQALVVKRTQSSIRLVPPCNLTGDLISIVGKSVQEDDRWKAEAFLQCPTCSEHGVKE